MKLRTLQPCAAVRYEKAIRFQVAGQRVRWSWLRNDEARYIRAQRQRARLARLFRAHLEKKAYFATSLEELIIAHATPETMRKESAWLTRYEKTRTRGKR